MSKAEKYLYDRLETLEDEKVILLGKVKSMEIEISETEIMMNKISENADDSFEVFSPRVKKNDFVKTEMESLSKRKNELITLLDEYKKHLCMIDEDIENIIDSLKEDKVNFYGIESLKREELERQRIARELHDSTIQTLTGLVHKCEICSKIADVDPTRAKLELEIMSRLLRDTINETRKIIYNLRPMSFDDFGLETTIEKVIDIIRQNTSVGVNLLIKGEKKEISPVVGLTLIRIIQESTSNSLKHSFAKRIDVVINYLEKSVRLTIKDDGKGFDVNVIKEKKNSLNGFGIPMMKERVFMMSGKINIESDSNGTLINIEVPIINN